MNYMLTTFNNDTDEVRTNDVYPIWNTPIIIGQAHVITFLKRIRVYDILLLKTDDDGLSLGNHETFNEL